MRLTKQTNYAIRMLMYCAANEGELSRVPEIAKAYSVSELFLFKILHPLVEAGLMQTVRGRNGGVKLAKPADEIFVSDVVKVTEENFAMAEWCYRMSVGEFVRSKCNIEQSVESFFRRIEGNFHCRFAKTNVQGTSRYP